MFRPTIPHLAAKPYAPATEAERAAYLSIGREAAEAVASRTHPYLLVDEERFDRLCDAFGTDAEVRALGDALIARAESLLQKDAYQMNEDGTALLRPIENPATDGYDVGGRYAISHTSVMPTLALAYRLTGKERYARLAYLIGRSMAEQPHWGPGHFLNTAEESFYFAIGYDWLAPVWDALGLDRAPLVHGLFRNGARQGYLSIVEDTCDVPSERQGTGWRFKWKADNWNAVCNNGMLATALLLMSERELLDGESYTQLLTLFGGALCSIAQPHLVLHQYVPDGSYVESNSYWAYGTGALFRALGLLKSALGTDLDLHKSEGLDKTCYYAIHTESAEYVGWNYHDGSLGAQDTSFFFLFADVSGDMRLAALRREHLSRGKQPTVYDAIYHPAVTGTEVPPLGDVPLCYHMKGIDGFTVRDGWGRGSLYAAILGGYNPEGASHNQLDSGTFVYHNLGHMWFCDMGSDYYNIRGGYFDNYHLYRRSAEGNNVLALGPLPHGQAFDATGYITRAVTDGPTPLVIIDNREIYAPYAERALRAMRLDTATGVLTLQDEARFTEEVDAFWIGHVEARINVCIDEDGRHVRLVHEDGATLFVALAGDADARFELRDCYDFLLSGSASFEGEHDRSGYRRLVVRRTGDTLTLSVRIGTDSAALDAPLTPITAW